MGKLEIYDPPPPPPPTTEPTLQQEEHNSVLGSIAEGWRRVREAKNNTCSQITRKKEQCRELEEKALATVKPVTRYIPITYDTVKRVSVVTLCTLSGVLQGRRRGGVRRFVYPMLGFTVGSAACFPNRTFSVARSTGATIAASGPVISNTASRIAELVRSAAPAPPAIPTDSVNQEPDSVKQEPADDIKEFLEQRHDDPVEATEAVIEATKVVIETTEALIETSEALATAAVNEVVAIEEEVLPAIADATVALAEATIAEVGAVKVEVAAVGQVAHDVIIAVEAIEGEVEGELEKVEGDLGMGDTDNDDMYSTRS